MGVLLMIAATAPAATWSGLLLTDGQQIEGRVEVKSGVISGGPLAAWHEEQPDELWAAGAFACLDVTPDGQIPIRHLIPPIGDWLNLPETVPATIKLGGTVEVVNLADHPQAAGGPMVELEVGPTIWSLRFAILEGSDDRSELPIDDGWTFFFGLRPIRF
jgi:hypothetical protein